MARRGSPFLFVINGPQHFTEVVFVGLVSFSAADVNRSCRFFERSAAGRSPLRRRCLSAVQASIKLQQRSAAAAHSVPPTEGRRHHDYVHVSHAVWGYSLTSDSCRGLFCAAYRAECC